MHQWLKSSLVLIVALRCLRHYRKQCRQIVNWPLENKHWWRTNFNEILIKKFISIWTRCHQNVLPFIQTGICHPLIRRKRKTNTFRKLIWDIVHYKKVIFAGGDDLAPADVLKTEYGKNEKKKLNNCKETHVYIYIYVCVCVLVTNWILFLLMI